jgi:hypothetical protein
MKKIIVDLDNCISDDTWRLAKIGRHIAGKNEFERHHDYHLCAAFDKPRNLDIFSGRRASEVIIMTARPAHYRAIAEVWLNSHMIPYDVLIMRNDKDHRPSVNVKRDQLGWLQAHYDTPLTDIEAAYDDHPEIIEMYREHGLNAIHTYIEYRTGDPRQLNLQLVVNA